MNHARKPRPAIVATAPMKRAVEVLTVSAEKLPVAKVLISPERVVERAQVGVGVVLDAPDDDRRDHHQDGERGERHERVGEVAFEGRVEAVADDPAALEVAAQEPDEHDDEEPQAAVGEHAVAVLAELVLLGDGVQRDRLLLGEAAPRELDAELAVLGIAGGAADRPEHGLDRVAVARAQAGRLGVVARGHAGQQHRADAHRRQPELEARVGLGLDLTDAVVGVAVDQPVQDVVRERVDRGDARGDELGDAGVTALGGADHDEQLAAVHGLKRLARAHLQRVQLLDRLAGGADDDLAGFEAARAVLADVDRVIAERVERVEAHGPAHQHVDRAVGERPDDPKVSPAGQLRRDLAHVAAGEPVVLVVVLGADAAGLERLGRDVVLHQAEVELAAQQALDVLARAGGVLDVEGERRVDVLEARLQRLADLGEAARLGAGAEAEHVGLGRARRGCERRERDEGGGEEQRAHGLAWSSHQTP
ncbi:MAG: hypothetical protein R3A51_11585 [Nannocystaceae bacterium]